MALFAIWLDRRKRRDPDEVAQRLLGEIPYRPDEITTAQIPTPAGAYNLVAFPTATAFLGVADQAVVSDREACVVHGYPWQSQAGRPRVLTAAEVGPRLSVERENSLEGLFSIVKVNADGTLLGLTDRHGLHHLYYSSDGEEITVANRPGMVAAVTEAPEKDIRSLLWLPAIGYRVGEGTSYKVARAVPQGHGLVVRDGKVRVPRLPGHPLDLKGLERGYSRATEEIDALVDQGLEQATAALRLAFGDRDPVVLPITGGKDSRVVLALALAAGFRDRLRLFTNGPPDHPDVVVGRQIAAHCSLPFREPSPEALRRAPIRTAEDFLARIARFTALSDGMLGAWNLAEPKRLGRAVRLTGHFGGVLKASTKRPSADDDPGDPIEMLRLRGPFDPLALLSAEAVVELHNQLTSQLSSLLDAGGLERADLSDVFYYRNRIPNWLGALTQAQAFEAQSVMPLSSPALVRAAFRLTAAERRSELIHFLVLSRLAPDLLELPFAMHSWSESLLEHMPELTIAPPVVVPAGTHTRVFGSWQYSINQNANLRAALANLVEDASGLGVWDWVDRNRLLALLRTKEFSFLEILSLLGLLPLILFEAGRSRQVPIGESTPSWSLPRPSLSYRGSVDVIRGPGSLRFRKRRRRRSTAKVAATGSISLEGWARCEQLPGARVAVELVAEDGAVLARVPANRMRHDLARAGSTDGRHAFCLLIDAQDVRQVIERNGGRCRCTVRVVESAFTLTHGDLVFRCP